MRWELQGSIVQESVFNHRGVSSRSHEVMAQKCLQAVLVPSVIILQGTFKSYTVIKQVKHQNTLFHSSPLTCWQYPVITHQFLTFVCEFPVHSIYCWHIATVFPFNMEEMDTPPLPPTFTSWTCLGCLLHQHQATAIQQCIGGKTNGICMWQCRCTQNKAL